MRWFTRGDVDGFFGLALDNLVQLLLIDGLCRVVLGFDAPLLYGKVLPGVAASLLLGNLYYAWAAQRLARKEGRDDVCALPYGINTVSLFAFVFLVMLPAQQRALADPSLGDPALYAWRAGLLACFGSGLIEFLGAFFAERLRRATPRAALLSTLAGIALGFISLGFFFRTFARPLIGLSTLGVVMLTYFGRVGFKGGLPGGLVAVALGAGLAWATGLSPAGPQPTTGITLSLPIPVLGDLLAALSSPTLLRETFAILLPMGLFTLIGSLQNIESADAAGDRYETAPSLLANGAGTLVGALFGSVFPTTLYIGHAGWKAMGSRAGYSILNAIFITAICLTGTLGWITWAIPIDAGMAIVLWIGIVITAQSFQATPREHAPAVVVGLLPGLAAWGTLLAKTGASAGGRGTGGGEPFGPDLIDAFQRSDIWLHGGLSLEQGFIFTAMILSAATVAVIERKFLRAAVWCFACAALAAVGLVHSYTWGFSDTALSLTPAWPWVRGWLAMGGVFFVAKWTTTPHEGH